MSPSGNETLQVLLGQLGQRGERLALAQIGHGIRRDLSYAELDAESARLAGGFEQAGLSSSDRAILLAPNSPDWLIACVALLRAGVVPVPVDSQMGGTDLEHIVRDCGAEWIFTTTLGAQRLADLDIASSVRIVLLDEQGESGDFWRDLCVDAPVPAAGVSPRDTAVIFYTSGTSGFPKGVPLTHENIVSNVSALLSLNIVGPDDRALLPLPLHHVYPFVIGLLTPLSLGMTVVVPSSLVGQHFFAALGEGQPTVLLGVPRLYEAICSAIEQRFESKGRVVAGLFYGLLALATRLRAGLNVDIGRALFWVVRRGVGPRLRLLISGGSLLDPGIAAKLEGLGFQLAAGYGLTETSPILTFRSAEMRGDGHVGRALPGVELRVADPDTQFEHGEVQAKGPNVFSGYLNLPEKSAEAFTADGWFRTGDLGYFDSKGFLRLSGRASSMIVMPGGENVDPEKIEQQLEQSAWIREIGILEHEGQLAGVVVPSAELARNQDAEGIAQAIRTELSRLSRELASYQRLSDFVIDHSPLPRTRLGKLRRKELTARYAEINEAGGQGPEPGLAPRASLAPLDRELLEDRIAASVWDWLGARFEGQHITPDTHVQLDLGVDSLEWLNLTLEIRNRIGIELTDEAVGRIETVRDLLQEAAGSSEAGELSGDVITLLGEPESLLTDDERAWLEPRGLRSGVLDAIASRAAAVFMRLYFRFRASGVEHLPAEGPFLIAPNHLSALDPLAVAAAIDSRRFKETFWGGWVGILYKGRIRSAFSHAMRILPVEPRSGPISNLALAAVVLHRGHSLVWFPEGERARSSELLRFRPGIGLLILAQRVPVVPVWIEGAGRALPPGKLLPRPSKVTLRFGKPADADELEAEGQGATPEERIADALRERVSALSVPSGRAAT
ncbi:MAG: AMP-binding protein [Gammaproteobacteria bacterium]|nr:AMP-binding protein [Gammaproteobacteria bacterium]